MTNTLLTLIAVLLLARIVLLVWQGKETLKRVYATASEVENTLVVCNRSQYHIREVLKKMQAAR